MTVSMVEASVEKLREEELEEARAIQSVMLPSEPLRAGAVRISHQFQPVAAVGGDFLDYFELSDGSVGLYLVSTLNRRLLVQGVPRRYSATQYAVFDPRTAQMHVTSAGMPGPFHLSAEGCRVLEIPGLPPGLFAEAQYDTSTLTLQPGDSILFCTDGITDAFNTENEAFGISRLQSVCENGLRIPPRELLGRVFTAVEAFAQGGPQHDDMAAAVFHYGLLTPFRK